MIRILWFSQHDMTKDQVDDLLEKLPSKDYVTIVKIDGQLKDVTSPFPSSISSIVYVDGEIEYIALPTEKQISSLVEESEGYDYIAVVMPFELQAELFDHIKIPLLIPKSKRERKNNGGFSYIHKGWKRVNNLVLEIEDF